MSTNYILRLRQLLDTVRKLEGPDPSPAVEEQLAELERELQAAATEMTIQACRQEIERGVAARDRRQSSVPVASDRRLNPGRRSTDRIAAIAADVLSGAERRRLTD